MIIENSNFDLKLNDSVNNHKDSNHTVNTDMMDRNEILSKRKINSKTFKKKKGVFETRYYNYPVHCYDDKTGSFIEFDKGLEESEDKLYFKNKNPNFNIMINKQENNHSLFIVKKEDSSVSVNIKDHFGEKLSIHPPILDIEHNKLTYPNINGRTDYECRVVNSIVKSEIIIKEAGTSGRYTFTISCENIKYNLIEAEKTILFSSKETGDILFSMSMPYITDSNGTGTGNIDFEVVEKADCIFELSIVADYGWLMSEERAYPIAMGWNTRYIEKDSCGMVFDSNSISPDGKISITGKSSKFKMNLPALKEDVITKKVKAIFHCDSLNLCEDKEYRLVLSRLSANVNDKDVSNIIGVHPITRDKNDYMFDVISEYGTDKETMYSLQLCEESDGDLIAVSNPDEAVNISVMSEEAVYAVSETDGTSDEDSSSGESGNIGSFGTYNIDLVSGLLNMDVKDFAWEGNRMPVSINHSFEGINANKSNIVVGGTTTSFGSMLVGKGWRINLMQALVHTGTSSEHDGKDTYTYLDENGEEIVFVQKDCEDRIGTCSVYEDADGFGYTYDTNTGIMEKGTEHHYFSSGRLTKIVDEYNNSITITYSSGRISSVTDGVGRVFVFGYSGNYLASIKAPNNACIKYTYSNGNLNTITFPNGQVLTFTYGTNNMPVSAKVSGSGIQELTTSFTYTNGKVTNITTTNSDKSTSFAYDSNAKQTIVTETETGDANCAAIKYSKVYLHDYSDKNYSYYDTGDDSKIAVSGSTGVILPYTDPGMDIGKLSCKNLLRNHNFDRGITSPTSCGWSTNLTGDYRIVMTETAEKMPGYCSAYLISLMSSDRQKGIWQTVNLSSGKNYVFSCYLKLGYPNTQSAHGVYLMVKTANGEIVHRSKMITEKGDFVRVALPFYVDGECGLSYTVGIYIDGNVKAKVIAPQLEEGTKLSPYNYLASNETSKLIPSHTPENLPAPVATVKVAGGKGVKETFTLSGYVSGQVSSNSENAPYGALRAHVNYVWTTEEKRDNSGPAPSKFWVPVYSESQGNVFAMLQFSKTEYRSIESIDIICENNYNVNSLIFSGLQLVRNSYVDGLSEEDFAGTNSAAMEEYDDDTDEMLMTSSTESDKDEFESITFEEVLDSYGNALTGTNFKNGELGTIYSGYKYEETTLSDDYTDVGNNKTQEIDARGNVTRYTYDSKTSKPTKVTDRCGNSTSYTYDTAGRTTSVTAPTGAKVNYTYNSYDDLTGITRGDAQSYTMAYDAHRNLTGVNVGSQNLVTYNYKAGTERLKTMTYANGAVQSLTYDRYGNVIGEKWTKSGVTEAEYRYFYDASNQLVKTLDITNKKMYNINRVGENVASTEEYNVSSISSGYIASGLTLVGTMYYSFDSKGKQFRKKYVDASGNEQKYVFEYQDEQNVAVQLPTGAVSHAKSDHLGRKVFDELQLGKGFMNRKFTYHEGVATAAHINNDKMVSNPETTLVKQIAFADGRTIQYEYDKEERITKVIDSVDGTYEYTYDELGQLLTEKKNGTTVNTMTYDGYGNIKTKNGITYSYNSAWKDKLVSYNGQSITYDANGNPTTYLGKTLVWEKGRQLKSYGSYTYKYNNEGIRISKTISGVEHKYVLDGTNIVKETWGSNTLIPLYDLDGTVCGIKYNGTAYYFYKNLQGDIIAITNSAGTVVARYTYDAWGKCTITSDTSGVSIATINPFRYRGYYYDTESGMYYLQSRYYDPAVGRFINADDSRIINMFYGITIVNIYTYCENNPVKNIDPTGYLVWPGQIHDFVQSVLALYIWIYLGCFTHINYFIRFSLLNYGFADLYAEKWNEIWEVKPDKTRYYTSGPKQLAKYIGAVDGAKVGRNLGLFTTYYYDNTGLYKVDIRSDSSDGMIYYKYSYCWKVTAAILILVGSIVLLKTGVGAGVGAKGLAAAAKLLLV